MPDTYSVFVRGADLVGSPRALTHGELAFSSFCSPTFSDPEYVNNVSYPDFFHRYVLWGINSQPNLGAGPDLTIYAKYNAALYDQAGMMVSFGLCNELGSGRTLKIKDIKHIPACPVSSEGLGPDDGSSLLLASRSSFTLVASSVIRAEKGRESFVPLSGTSALSSGVWFSDLFDYRDTTSAKLLPVVPVSLLPSFGSYCDNQNITAGGANIVGKKLAGYSPLNVLKSSNVASPTQAWTIRAGEALLIAGDSPSAVASSPVNLMLTVLIDVGGELFSISKNVLLDKDNSYGLVNETGSGVVVKVVSIQFTALGVSHSGGSTSNDLGDSAGPIFALGVYAYKGPKCASSVPIVSHDSTTTLGSSISASLRPVVTFRKQGDVFLSNPNFFTSSYAASYKGTNSSYMPGLASFRGDGALLGARNINISEGEVLVIHRLDYGVMPLPDFLITFTVENQGTASSGASATAYA